MIKNVTLAGKCVAPAPYHAQTAKRGTPEFVMSPSSINAFARLPSRWYRGWNPPDTKAKSWGDIIDCICLTPQLVSKKYAVHPETYPCTPTSKDPRTSKPWRFGANFTDEWKQAQEARGLTILSPATLKQAKEAQVRLLETVDGDDTIKRWFEACDVQVHLKGEWHDEETGLVIPLGCLLDFAPRKDTEFASCLGDFKSTRCAHPIKFSRQAFDMGWHRQAAFNIDMYRAAFPDEDRNTWAFIIQENFEPWEPNRAFYGAEGDMGQPGFIELGRESKYGGYKYWLELYCQCIKTGRWPGYNHTDESVQGWAVLRPEPFQAERLQFTPQFEIPPDEAVPAEDPNDFTP